MARLVALAAAAALTAAAPSLRSGWTPVQRSPPDALIHFTVAVRIPEAGRAALTAELYAVSDPASPRYGGHLSRDAVDALTAPHPASVAAVTAWLTSLGAPGVQVAAGGGWASADLPVSVLERALGAEYWQFATADGAHVVHRCSSYTLPPEVAAHVDFVGPVNRAPPAALAPALSAGRAFTSLGAGGGLRGGADGVTPASLRKQYGEGLSAEKGGGGGRRSTTAHSCVRLAPDAG